MAEPLRLRAGTKVGRTLYRVRDDGTDELVGVVDTPALAERIVAAVNAYTPPAARCGHHGVPDCDACAANPASCAADHPGPAGCGAYAATGMHWDTCPNRREEGLR